MPYGSSDNFCNIGSAKANVLPLPVFAQPIQSLPAKICGIQFCWIGVGFFKPEINGNTIFSSISLTCKLILTHGITLINNP